MKVFYLAPPGIPADIPWKHKANPMEIVGTAL